MPSAWKASTFAVSLIRYEGNERVFLAPPDRPAVLRPVLVCLGCVRPTVHSYRDSWTTPDRRIEHWFTCEDCGRPRVFGCVEPARAGVEVVS